MEMTLQRLGLGNVRQMVGGAVMPLGILALVAMMVFASARFPARYLLRIEHSGFITHSDGGDAHAASP